MTTKKPAAKATKSVEVRPSTTKPKTQATLSIDKKGLLIGDYPAMLDLKSAFLEVVRSRLSICPMVHLDDSFADAGSAFAQYRDELFRFDQLYRHFHTATDAVEPTHQI